MREDSPGITAALGALVTPSTQAMRTHRSRINSRQPVAPSPALSSSHPCWLRPRRHAEQEHLTEGPHMVGQPRGHRWRLGLPALGRAAAMGGLGLRQGQTYAGMGQTEIVIGMIQGQLLVYAVLAFAERRHTPPDRGEDRKSTRLNSSH